MNWKPGSTLPTTPQRPRQRNQQRLRQKLPQDPLVLLREE